jgi:hypothetical protein
VDQVDGSMRQVRGYTEEKSGKSVCVELTERSLVGSSLVSKKADPRGCVREGSGCCRVQGRAALVQAATDMKRNSCRPAALSLTVLSTNLVRPTGLYRVFFTSKLLALPDSAFVNLCPSVFAITSSIGGRSHALPPRLQQAA